MASLFLNGFINLPLLTIYFVLLLLSVFTVASEPAQFSDSISSLVLFGAVHEPCTQPPRQATQPSSHFGDKIYETGHSFVTMHKTNSENRHLVFLIFKKKTPRKRRSRWYFVFITKTLSNQWFVGLFSEVVLFWCYVPRWKWCWRYRDQESCKYAWLRWESNLRPLEC